MCPPFASASPACTTATSWPGATPPIAAAMAPRSRRMAGRSPAGGLRWPAFATCPRTFAFRWTNCSRRPSAATACADGLATLKGEGQKLPAGEQPAVLIADVAPSPGTPGEGRGGGRRSAEEEVLSAEEALTQHSVLSTQHSQSPLPNPPPEYR